MEEAVELVLRYPTDNMIIFDAIDARRGGIPLQEYIAYPRNREDMEKYLEDVFYPEHYHYLIEAMGNSDLPHSLTMDDCYKLFFTKS